MNYRRAVGYGLATLLMYLGVTLLGWGLDDLPGFFASAPRAVYAVLVGLFSLAIAVQAISAPEGIVGDRGDADKRVRRQTIMGAVLTGSLFVMMVFMPFADRRGIGVVGDESMIRWAGVVLCGLGYALVFWSGLSLGRQYSAEVTIQPDHHLITSGAYRVIRHPRYLGVLCLAVGVPLLFHSWIGLLVSVLVLAVLQVRIGDEEVLMSSEFGLEWDSYRRHSWRLIPYVY